MRRTFALIVAAGLMVALLAIPGTAFSRATFTRYTATETQLDGPNFESVPTEGEPVKFTSVFEDRATDPRASGITSVSGTITFTDLATFTGTMRGTSLTDVTGEGYEGTWVGRWRGRLTGGGESVYWAVARGTGDLVGMRMFMTFDSARDPMIKGVLLDFLDH